jgi:orotate phosphoribosyltransferase-like protein
MRVHWEKLGILGPVYHLVGQGLSDNEIAGKLNVSVDNVRRCVVWLLRFGSHASRAELILNVLSVSKSANSRPECAAAKEAS